RQARVLALESDPRATSRTMLEERALQAGVWLAPEQTPWDKPWLSAPLREWVKARLLAIFQDESAFSALTDAGLASFLLLDPCEDFASGVLPVQDHRLLLMAHEAGVPVRGLEAWDSFLADMSQPDQQETAEAIALVQAASLNPDGFHAARAAAFRLYREGRLAEMGLWAHVYLEGILGKKRAGHLLELADGYLVHARNHRFLRAISSELEQGNAVFVVGAAQLSGADGVLSGLAAAGYRVRRLPVPGEAP
ncbi:MAG: TraB/GumN family protein, partial [Rhodobacteraceae bacterium]|nr:TraB/GumN family protein [Paracoccaceae bacterium]